jgi:hypothetical protein
MNPRSIQPGPDPQRPHTGGAGRTVALLAALLLAGVAQQAQAARCIPIAQGVPALSGAPQFLDAAAGEPNYWPRQDDPRWRGALAQSFGSGASELVSFRAVRNDAVADNALYLSWNVKVDPFLVPLGGDRLRVAISTGAGTGQMYEIVPFNDLTGKIAQPADGTTYRTLGGGVWTNATAPAWFATNTRVWLDTPNQQWSINMRIPIRPAFDDGVNLPAQFNLAFELRDRQSNDPNGMVAFYRSSDSVSLNTLASVPAPNTWPEFNRTLAPGAAGCDAAVRLASTDVGTTQVDGGGVARPHRIDINGVNTFFALPENATTTPVGANQISATFRIANWGTQPNWNDVADPLNALWKTINSSAVTNAGGIAAGTKASIAGGNALTFNWTPSFNEKCELIGKAGIPANQSPTGVAIPGDAACPNQNPTRRLHQCILVSLSGGGLIYNPDSVYRNMDFVDASTFERDAEVSVAGLSAFGAPKRDVFLYVQKLMMPASVGKPSPGLVMYDYRKVWDVLRKGGHNTAAAMMVSGGDKGEFEVPERPPLGGDFEILNQFYPTYVVHAFHDTGETVDVDGDTLRVVRPQSSFGYYVHHEGALTGWDTELQGAQLISPNFYKLGVPDGGSAVVKTRIVAREQDGPPPIVQPGGWWEKLKQWLDSLPFPWWWLLIALIVLLLLWLLLRRKK